MTKKERKEIAEMWAAGLLIMCGADSFEPTVSEKDIDDILLRVNVIAIKLAKGRKQYYTLKEIIQQALAK
jgi:hypothetical protein